MNQNRYFTNDSSIKPQTTTEGVETRKYSGNPLLREVDEELKRLRSQFDKVASGTTSTANATTTQSSSGGYTGYSNCINLFYLDYPSGSSPQGSRIERVEESSRPSYGTEGFQQASYTTERENYHRDVGRFSANETVGASSQGINSYAYQGSGSVTNNSGSFNSGSLNQGSTISNSGIQRGAVTTKTASNNGSFEFKSPKNLTNSGRYVEPSQQLQTQYSQSSQSSSQQGSQIISQQASQQVSQQVSQQGSQQGSVQVTSPALPVIEVTNNDTFKLPASKPEVVRISSPQSETIRINSPPKIRAGPTPAEIAKSQE